MSCSDRSRGRGDPGADMAAGVPADKPLDPRIRRIAEAIGRQIAREQARGIMPGEDGDTTPA